MKYLKVQFSGDINIIGYQAVDDSLTNVIGYVNLDCTDIDLTNKEYSCNVIDNFFYTDDDLSPGYLWHDSGCTMRIKISNHNNLTLLQSYPELGMYIKMNNINSYIESNYSYMYVNYILPEHKTLLEAYGAIIITKTENIIESK